jgi:hypothetical protein
MNSSRLLCEEYWYSIKKDSEQTLNSLLIKLKDNGGGLAIVRKDVSKKGLSVQLASSVNA